MSETAGEPPGYLPRRDIDQVRLSELFAVVRRAGENRFLSLEGVARRPVVEQVMEELEQGMAAALAGRSLGDLLPERGGAVSEAP